MKYLVTALMVLTFGIIPVSVALAASSDILVNITPTNPAPLEDTSITLSSYANNLDTVLISWSVSGRSVSSGIGKKSLSLKAPAAGSETTVVVKIALPDGTVETNIVIKPSVMVLLWQANDSYVPPFYRGKALPSLGSEIKVVAMPEVKGVSSSNMTYAWKKDYTNDAGGSGYGKNFFTYTNDYLENSSTISVTASTVDQNYSSDASIDVGATSPKILFYKNDNDLGVAWERALTDPYKIQGSGIISAIPYFISPKELYHPNLIWNWFINDNPINILSFKKNIIPLQAESGVSGVSHLKLNIENGDKIWETVSREMNIEF